MKSLSKTKFLKGAAVKSLQYSNGDSMPILGLGTWKSAEGEVYSAVRTALEAGYRHIDCALVYGNEKEVGRALSDCMSDGTVAREELWITSKLWNNSHGRENVLPALRTTLANLRLEYLDLYLVHWPVAFRHDVDFPKAADEMVSLAKLPLAATWAGMEDAADTGLTRHIGVCNFSVSKLEHLRTEGRIPPEMNQVELHPYFQQIDLADYCREKGIHMTAYSPLGSGDRGAGLKKPGEPVVLNDPVLAEIASELGVTPAQVILSWIMSRGISVIPKSVNPGRIQQNLESCEISLSESQMRRIASINRDYRLIDGGFFAIPGSGYTLESIWG